MKMTLIRAKVEEIKRELAIYSVDDKHLESMIFISFIIQQAKKRDQYLRSQFSGMRYQNGLKLKESKRIKVILLN